MALPYLAVVAVALIAPDGRVLLQQRPPGRALAGLWEFPGGKIEPGETPVAALVREVAEELGVAIDPADLSPLSFASTPINERHLLLLLFAARRWAGTPAALDAAAIRWATVDEMRGLPMPPADVPLVEALATLFGADSRSSRAERSVVEGRGLGAAPLDFARDERDP